MATSKMMQWSIDKPDSELKGMSYTEVSIPQVGENEVLVKFQAAALNYRDVAIGKVIPSSRNFIQNFLS
jgi:NADPH:quinone reductase and related Zn-dependent oxidoreductases